MFTLLFKTNGQRFCVRAANYINNMINTNLLQNMNIYDHNFISVKLQNA